MFESEGVEHVANPTRPDDRWIICSHEDEELDRNWLDTSVKDRREIEGIVDQTSNWNWNCATAT